MATTRIAAQPRVPRSPKSAKLPLEVQPLVRPEVPANDPVVAQARALADTIRQLGRGRVPRDLPNLPLFSDAASSPPPGRPKTPSRLEGRKSRPRQSGVAAPPDLARHRRKCVVCNHPDRQEIEEQFIEWRHPGDIANDFQIEEVRYIRRHARALGLYARRRENYLFTLENLLERSDEIELTAAAYIKAVRAYACMCDTVRWTEPAIRVIGIRDSSAASQDRVDNEEQVSSSSSLLPQAASEDGALCGSGRNLSPPQRREPQRKTSLDHASASECLEGRGSSSTSPRASSRSCVLEEKSVPAPSSLLPQAALNQPAAAKPAPPAPLPASGFEPPASGTNRPSPRLETSVTDTKQKEGVIPNRPQFAK